MYIYIYVYLHLHLKEIYPLCTWPSFGIAIPGYLLWTSVNSLNHNQSIQYLQYTSSMFLFHIPYHPYISIYIYRWCIYLQISVDFCYDFHVGKYTMWIFCGHGIPTWSPAEAFTNHHPRLDLCPGVRYGARMGEGIKKGSQMAKLHIPSLGTITYPPMKAYFWRWVFFFRFGGIYWFPGG